MIPALPAIVDFVREVRGQIGLWDTTPQQASRWITFDLLRSLSKLGESGEPGSAGEPRTPFQTYPKQPRRY